MQTIQRSSVDVLTRIARECSADSYVPKVERRASPRFLLRIPVVCTELNDDLQHISEFISARTLNVSSGGILLASARKLNSRIVSVTFCDWEGVPYELTAKIVHQETINGEFLTGAEFISPVS